MRKSERLRLLEMQMVRIEILVDLLQSSVASDSSSLNIQDMDAGKWYKAKPDTDTPK